MKKEVSEKFVILITSAFGLVAALAWNSAVQELFRTIYPTGAGLTAMFIYAVAVTFIAVFVTIWVAKINHRK